LNEALRFVRRGDTVVTCRPDRLARSTTDLLRIVNDLDQRGIGLIMLSIWPADRHAKPGDIRTEPTARAEAAEVVRLDAEACSAPTSRRIGTGIASVHRVLAEAKQGVDDQKAAA
jgi:hypothetical protein